VNQSKKLTTFLPLTMTTLLKSLTDCTPLITASLLLSACSIIYRALRMADASSASDMGTLTVATSFPDNYTVTVTPMLICCFRAW